MNWSLLWTLVLTLTTSVLSSLLFLKYFRKLGLKKTEQSNQVRWSNQPKPTIGGLGMMIAYVSGATLLWVLNQNEVVMYLAIPLFFAAVVGLIDDLKAVKALLKLFMQLLCGILLVTFDFGFQTFLPDVVDAGLSIFWTVLIMNSINMLDNMDGISGVVSMLVFLLVSLLLLPFAIHDPARMLNLLLCIICFGFLFFNKPNSKMYMGDAGSQFIGVALAWSTMMLVSIDGLFENHYVSIWSVIVLLLPSLADTCLVVVNRLRFKTSPFLGGRDHSTHNFAYLGLSGRNVFLLFGALSTFGAWLVYKIQTGSTNLFLYISVTYVVAYLFLVFKASAINLKNKKYTYS